MSTDLYHTGCRPCISLTSPTPVNKGNVKSSYNQRHKCSEPGPSINYVCIFTCYLYPLPPPPFAFKVFDSQIMPILEYGSQLWYKARQNHKLETFHLGYLKRTLGLRLQRPTYVVLSDTGCFALQLRRNLNVIKYWLRMFNLQANDPLRNTYDTLVQLHNLGQSNWWIEVTTLLASLQISDPEFPELNLTDKNNKLFDTLKEKVYSTYMENCMARTKSNTEGKLRIFRTFKQDYCMESYLLLLPNLKHMSTIARFWMSSHTLSTETGRHAKPKIAKEERKCRYPVLQFR